MNNVKIKLVSLEINDKRKTLKGFSFNYNLLNFEKFAATRCIHVLLTKEADFFSPEGKDNNQTNRSKFFYLIAIAIIREKTRLETLQDLENIEKKSSDFPNGNPFTTADLNFDLYDEIALTW